MSTVVSKNVQIGADGTASNNFTAYQPATPDGTLRIGNGNSGSVTDAITLTSSGNVGIGTSSPNGKLQVKQANTAYGLVVEASGNDAWMRVHHNDSVGIVETTYNTSAGYTPLTFKTGGSERLRINSSGNVGIGTSSPAAKLQVKDGTDINVRVGALGSYASVYSINDAGSAYQFLRIDATDLLLNTYSGGNVGIGTSSPNATLEVKGTSDGQIRVTSNTNEITQIISGSTEASIRAVAAVPLTFRTSNLERLRITSSGNVGIGTSSPGAKLHINDSTGSAVTLLKMQTGWNNPSGQKSLVWSDSTSDLGRISVSYSAPEARMTFGSLYNSGYQSSDLMTLDASGNLLVGDTSYRLSGIATAGQAIQLGARAFIGTVPGGDTALGGLAGSNFTAIYQGGVERLRINFSGYVGIGTSSPTDKLTVSGGGIVVNSGNVKVSDGSTTFQMGVNNFATGYGMGTTSDASVIVATNNTSRARWYQSGSGAQGMYIQGNVDTSFYSSGSTTGVSIQGSSQRQTGNGAAIQVSSKEDEGWACMYLNRWYSSSTDPRYIQFSYAGSVTGSISRNGTGAVSYNTTSDYRLKENVIDLTGAIDRVKQLQPRRFNFIAEPEVTVDGFIAHEAQAVVPEAVTGVKDETKLNEEGETVPNYQGMDAAKLVPLLTAALQEALAQIESLTARVSALEGN